jgi:hypothetical protein
MPAHFGSAYAELGIPTPENTRPASREDTIQVYPILFDGPVAVKEACAARTSTLHAASGEK